MRTSAFQGRRSGRVLLCGGVAGAALFGAVGAVQAQSRGNDACGPLVEGRVTCAPGAYRDGIHYGGEHAGDITLDIVEGTTVEANDGRPAVHIVTQGGAIVIDGTGVNLTTKNASGVAALVEGGGDVRVTLGDITAVFDNSSSILRGVETFTEGGNTVIDVGHVRTSGDYATGILAASVAGDIDIRALSVGTDGALADGISASTNGAISINAGQIVTIGDESRGIVAEGGFGPIRIVADSIVTNGFASDGVVATGLGDMSIAVNEINGTGDYIWGVNAFNGTEDEFGQITAGYTNVSIGKIDLAGANNIGVLLQSYGQVGVRVDDVEVNGDFGSGVVVIGAEGAILEVGNARFTGENTGNVSAGSFTFSSVKVGSLYSERGSGVAVQAGTGTAYAEVGTVDIGGDRAVGVAAGSTEGDATIRVDSVISRGFLSSAIVSEAYSGTIRIDAGSVTTLGDYSRGLFIYGKEAIVLTRGPVETSGIGSTGMLVSSIYGNAQMTAAGSVTTRGAGAIGILGTGRFGLADITAVGPVTTLGEQSHGIAGYGEHAQLRIAADRVVTSGNQSNGIHARTRYAEIVLGGPDVSNPPPFTGDIDVRVADVRVTGEDSIAVSARGLGDARLLIGHAFSQRSFAVESDMIRDIVLDLRGSAVSERGSAVMLKGETINASIGAGARIEGAVDGLVLTAGARCVLPEPMDGKTPNPCPNPGRDDLYSPAPPIPQPILAGGVATVNNAGTIAGGSGHAIRLTHGALRLTNTGEIRGSFLLAGDDDRIDNAGRLEFARDSDFGAGFDVLSNTGVIALSAATAPLQVTLRNLERLENGGLIDLRNGVVGDRLTVSGDFVGRTGSTVALDIDLAKNSADRLVIVGAATGTTQLTLKGDHSTATLGGLDGLVVVETGVGSSATAFALAPGAGDLGFVGHSLSYDDVARRYALKSAAGAAAYRQVGLMQAFAGVWTSGTDMWNAQNARTRDATASGAPLGGFWFTMQAGQSSRDWDAEMVGGGEADLDYDQERYGAQFGYERAVGSDLRVGVTAGYGQSTLDYAASSDAFDVSSFNLGAYAGITRDAAFANVLLKYDQHSTEISSAALAREIDLDGSTLGVDLEAGYRFGKVGFFVEPVVGIRWANSNSDDLVSGNQTLTFQDAEDVAGRLGFRVGGAQALSSGAQLSFYGGANVVHSFGDDYRLTLVSGGRQDVEAERVETWGQGMFGVSYRTAQGLETFAEGQGDIGSGYDGVSARVGMRVRF